ncbi:MAG TPA: type IX secretion system membrane protein PorP/SprF [Salinimicrobium sp.]|nr:type IX secretion system membrane protein PorP/SprF [Salinimicrobium sp.]
MKNIKNYIILTALVLLSAKGIAQQNPAFTQYMYNMSVINPGYATENLGVVNIGGLYRTQWVGIEGAPETATFFAHTPLSERVEMGISIVHDEIGNIVQENNIFADFAYVLPVSETTKISFGVKAGFTLFDANLTNLQVGSGDSSTDVAFNENINEAFPNVGVGAFLFGEKYYVGLSAPNLLNSKHLETEDGTVALGAEEIHFYFTGGYVFDLNEEFKLKPAFMLRGVPNSPLSVDITANVLFNDKFEAGIGYRLEDSFSGLVNFAVLPELRIGYAYDYNYAALGEYSSGSHEIMLLFDLNILSAKYDKSPRFF